MMTNDQAQAKTAIDFLNEKLESVNQYIKDHQESYEIGLKEHRHNPKMFTQDSLDFLIEKIDSASTTKQQLLDAIQRTAWLEEERDRLRAALEEIKDGLLVKHKKNNHWYNLAYNALNK